MTSKGTKSFGVLNLMYSEFSKETIRKFLKEHNEGIIICPPEIINDFYRVTMGLNIKIRESFDSMLKKYILSFKVLKTENVEFNQK